MNIFLYYFDKLTGWLDFSWLITYKDPQAYNPQAYKDPIYEPLLRE